MLWEIVNGYGGRDEGKTQLILKFLIQINPLIRINLCTVSHSNTWLAAPVDLSVEDVKRTENFWNPIEVFLRLYFIQYLVQILDLQIQIFT